MRGGVKLRAVETKCARSGENMRGGQKVRAVKQKYARPSSFVYETN